MSVFSKTAFVSSLAKTAIVRFSMLCCYYWIDGIPKMGMLLVIPRGDGLASDISAG